MLPCYGNTLIADDELNNVSISGYIEDFKVILRLEEYTSGIRENVMV